jgi:hypothetical protein
MLTISLSQAIAVAAAAEEQEAGDGGRFATSHRVGAAGAAIPATMWPKSVASTSRRDCRQATYYLDKSCK